MNDCFVFSFQSKASKRKNVLDEAYGQQGFLADSRDLVSFCIFVVHRKWTYMSLTDVETFHRDKIRFIIDFVCICISIFNYHVEKKS